MEEEKLDKPLIENAQTEFQVHIGRLAQDTTFYSLIFSPDSIILRNKNNVIKTLPYKDLIGYKEEKIDDRIHTIQLNSFPKIKRFLRSQKRFVQSYEIWTQMDEQTYEQLKVSLLRVITNRPIKHSQASLKLLIYLNPAAGSNSRKHFQAVKDFISHTNFSYDLIETTHRGHCIQHLETVQPKTYEAVIIISGDGLMHEFVNSKACGKIPVSHVPGGSGNAFAKTQTSLASEQCTDEVAIFLVVKGRTRQMNLVKMELEKVQRPIYSFLSLEWAFLADIDMNSEFLRFLGGLRFEVYSVYRIFALRKYNGRLTYSTTSTELPPLNQPINDPSFVRIESRFLNALFPSIPYISDKYQFAPLLKVEDEAVDMQFLTEEHSRWQLAKYLLNADSGSHFDREKGRPKEGFDFGYGKIKSYRLQPLGQGEEQGLYGIDGQRYDAQRMQASISDKKIVTFV